MIISDLIKALESQQKIIDALVDIVNGARADFQHLNHPAAATGVRVWAQQSVDRIDKAGAVLPFNGVEQLAKEVLFAKEALLKCRWCLKPIGLAEDYSALHDLCWGEDEAE